MKGAQCSMADVAKAARVHRTTVCRALRDDPLLKPETRARIRALARTMGYAPNPLVSALMAVRASQRPRAYQATLGFVSHHPDPQRWTKQLNAHDRMFAGAREQGRRLGYKLEVLWRAQPGMTAERFSRILRSRGIHGVLVAPSPDPSLRAELDWAAVAAVDLGFNLAWPDLHRVCHDYYHGMRLTLERLRAAGRRRIGLVLHARIDAKVHHLWHAAFVHEQLAWPGAERVEPLLFEVHDRARIARWVETERPDAVVGIEWQHLEPAIRSTRRRVPEEVALANLACDDTGERFAGIRQNFEQIGVAAMDLLVAMLHRNERGLPAQAQTTFLKGVWQDGPTLNVPA